MLASHSKPKRTRLCPLGTIRRSVVWGAPRVDGRCRPAAPSIGGFGPARAGGLPPEPLEGGSRSGGDFVAAQMQAIVRASRFRSSAPKAKWKVSQNRNAADLPRGRVDVACGAQGGILSTGMAELVTEMREEPWRSVASADGFPARLNSDRRLAIAGRRARQQRPPGQSARTAD